MMTRKLISCLAKCGRTISAAYRSLSVGQRRTTESTGLSALVGTHSRDLIRLERIERVDGTGHGVGMQMLNEYSLASKLRSSINHIQDDEQIDE